MGRQRGWGVVCLGGGGGGGTPGRILSKCGQTLFSVYEVYADALPHCEWYPRVAAEMCVTRQGRAGTICARPTLRDGGGIGGWPSGQVGLSPPGSGPTRVVPTRVWPHQSCPHQGLATPGTPCTNVSQPMCSIQTTWKQTNKLVYTTIIAD